MNEVPRVLGQIGAMVGLEPRKLVFVSVSPTASSFYRPLSFFMGNVWFP